MKNIELVKLYKFLLEGKGSTIEVDLKTRLKLKKILKSISDVYKHLGEVEMEVRNVDPLLDEMLQELIDDNPHLFQKDDKGDLKKDERGGYLIEGSSIEEFKNKRWALASSKKYKAAITKQEKKDQEWNELLNADADIKLEKIEAESFNNAQLTNSDWDILELIISEEA
jgi:hypothetical protein